MPDTYLETIQYLYTQLPVYHHIGARAYKKDLTNTLVLCEILDNPQRKFKTIHVAGTNGKGSSSHMLAAILQSAGYKTGLYTSPHLKDFSERIKINGVEIDHGFVVDFVNRMDGHMKAIQPSFFELTVAMAFEYFAREKVDIAVIEVGLGGRLDSTNIILPELSLITNIGYDHMDILGDTLSAIASEKAGIIKPKTPVVISERQPEIESVFIEKARTETAPILFATDEVSIQQSLNGEIQIKSNFFNETLTPELKGSYQTKNIGGVLVATHELRRMGWNISNTAIAYGINNTIMLTGLKGRWQIIRNNPLVVCDTGHNTEGILELVKQIQFTPHKKLRWVFGMVKDKQHEKVLSILPKDGHYYFCNAKIERALGADDLLAMATALGLNGHSYNNVNQALDAALRDSDPNDLIMVGGSTFIVAEVKDL